MTGFEQATLAAQHVALWIAAVDAAAVVIVAIAIWRGIREMERDNEELKRRREAGERRHEKVMAEIAAQREADERRHEEAMAEIAARCEAAQRRYEEAMAGEGPAAAARRS